jgi:hypothetical protein
MGAECVRLPLQAVDSVACMCDNTIAVIWCTTVHRVEVHELWGRRLRDTTTIKL